MIVVLRSQFLQMTHIHGHAARGIGTLCLNIQR